MYWNQESAIDINENDALDIQMHIYRFIINIGYISKEKYIE